MGRTSGLLNITLPVNPMGMGSYASKMKKTLLNSSTVKRMSYSKAFRHISLLLRNLKI
jgi:hypothetical protein